MPPLAVPTMIMRMAADAALDTATGAAARMIVMLEQRVLELKQIIAGNDGRNAADRRFARAVDELVSAVYDDIGEIKDMPTRALFDLFVIKVLYVGRHSRHAGVIDYLGRLLDDRLSTGELFPPDNGGRPQRLYFSDVLDRKKTALRFQDVFEAYRKYADTALFLSGVFPATMERRRAAARTPLRRRASRGVDAGYYISTGKTMYRMAAGHAPDEDAQQRETLARLARNFEVYVDALNEMSERYITGFDMELIADKMLDAFNRYRETGDARHLGAARRYAAILRVDSTRVPARLPADDVH